MAVVTLMTDWGLRDHHLAVFKGRLAGMLPGVPVFDITHTIQPHDTLQASYVLKNAYRQFPEGAVHYSGMMGFASGARTELLMVQSEGHSFVGIDNGLFSLVLGNAPRTAHAIELPASPKDWSEVVINCIRSLLVDKVVLPGSTERQEMINNFSPAPMTEPDAIRATVIYIDSFQNLVLNVTAEMFEQVRKNRSFTIEMQRVRQPIAKLSKWYHEAEEGEMVALFNSDGYLEIGLNRANASGLLGMNVYDTVRINFQ